MKVVILVSRFPPKWLGGTEIATKSMAIHLSKRGHNVHVITLYDKYVDDNLEGVQVHRIRVSNSSFYFYINYFIKVFFEIKNINPDIIHSQAISLNSFFAMISGLILNKPYVVWGQGSDVYLMNMAIKFTISKIIIREASAVIGLTEDMNREIKKIYNRYIYLLPNGLEFDNYKDISKAQIRKDLGLRQDVKIIIFVGNLRPVKGVKYLIRSFNYLEKYKKEILLLIVGDGNEKKVLEDESRNCGYNNIIFLGKMNNDDVQKYLIAADLFVLPSISEGFPITILEAMRAGLPIIASNVRGLSEIVIDDFNGFLVEPKRPDKIAEKITLLLDNGIREKIAENNGEISRKYSWQKIVKTLEDIYYECMKKTGPLL